MNIQDILNITNRKFNASPLEKRFGTFLLLKEGLLIPYKEYLFKATKDSFYKIKTIPNMALLIMTSFAWNETTNISTWSKLDCKFEKFFCFGNYVEKIKRRPNKHLLM